VPQTSAGAKDSTLVITDKIPRIYLKLKPIFIMTPNFPDGSLVTNGGPSHALLT